MGRGGEKKPGPPPEPRSRRGSMDTDDSNEVSTRSTVVRSRGHSARWETQSVGSATSADRTRRRGEREVFEDSDVYDDDDDGGDSRSEYSRYSYASSQYPRRSGYVEETSFLSQAMLGLSRHSLGGGSEQAGRTARRSVRSAGGSVLSNGRAGGGAQRRTYNNDEADRISLRSGRSRTSRSSRTALTEATDRATAAAERGEPAASSPTRSGARAPENVVPGADRSHVSMDGYEREIRGRFADPASAPSRTPGRLRRKANRAAAPANSATLTSTQLHALEVGKGNTGGGGGGRLRHLLSRPKSSTLEGLDDSGDVGTAREGRHPARDDDRFTPQELLAEATGSFRSSSSGTTHQSRRRRGSVERLSRAPREEREVSVAARSTESAGSGSSHTQRSSDRLHIASTLHLREGSSGGGSDKRTAVNKTSKGRGGIFSYAHSRLARRPVLAWRQPFRVTAMTSTVSGRLFTGGDPNGAIVAWDSRTGAAEYILEGHQAAVLALDLLASQELLLSASADHTARLWSLQTLQTLYTFQGHTGLVSCVTHAWLADLEAMAFFTGSDDATVRQWSVERGGAAVNRAEGGVAACLHVFTGHHKPVNALCCLEDATHVLSGDGAGVMRVWSTQARKCVTTLDAHDGEVLAIQQIHLRNPTIPTSEDGVAVYLVTAGNSAGGARGGCVRLWEANWMHTTVLLAELSVPDLMPSVRCLLTYRHLLFIGGGHGELMMWDTSSGDVTALFVFHTQAIPAITLHNSQLCSCSFDHHIARWDVLDLLGPEQQSFVPFQPYSTGAFKHASIFWAGSGGATPQTLALLRGARRAQASTDAAWTGADGEGDQLQGGESGRPRRDSGGGKGAAEGRSDADSAARSRLAAAAAYGLKDISAAEAAEAYAELPLAFVLSQLDSSRFTKMFFLDIVVSVSLFVFFCVLFGQLYPVAEGFYVNAGLEAQLGHFPLPSVRSPRTFFSINSVQLFFRWMDITVQHLWRDRAQTDVYPAASGNNILLSTLRLRVKRVTCTSCQWNAAVVAPGVTDVDTTAQGAITSSDADTVLCTNTSAWCFADWNMPGVKESTLPYLCPVSSMCFQMRGVLNISAIATAAGVDPMVGFPYDPLAHSQSYTTAFSSFSKGGFAVDFFYTDTFTAQRAKLAALESLGFIDDVATRLADVTLFTYNPNMDIFTTSTFTCEVPSAGAWLCMVRSSAFEVYNGHVMRSRLACHVCILLVTLGMGALCVVKFVQAARGRRLIRHLLSWLVWVDIVVIVLTLVVSGYFFEWMRMSAAVSVRELVEVTAANRRDELIAKNTQQRAQLTSVATIYGKYLRLAGIAAIGVGVRVTSSFSSLSYLAFFSEVLRRARPLIVAFIVMHTVLLLGFAQAAHLLYGRTLLDYSDLGRSFMSLVHRQWGSGDALNSIEAVLAERWASSVVFFFFFFVVFVLIAWSFFAAILANSYTETAKATAVIPLSQTLWKRAHDMRYRLGWDALRRTWPLQQLRRLRRCGRRLVARWRARRVRSQRAQSVVFSRSMTSATPMGPGVGSASSSHAPFVSSATSLPPPDDNAGEDDEDEAADDALLDSTDAFAERRLLRLLREKLEELGLGNGVDDGDEAGVSLGEWSGSRLSRSADLSGMHGSSESGSAASLPTWSSTMNSSSHLRGGPLWAQASHGAGTADAVGDGSRHGPPSTATHDTLSSDVNRRFGFGHRSSASGTAARSRGVADSSVAVECLRAKQQDRAHRLATVMVRKADLAFLLASVVEDATSGVARASETMDMFMDTYSRSFINHLWEDLAWHYHYVHRSEKRQKNVVKDVSLRERVESALVVLNPAFALVESAQRQLEAQEGHLWPLVQALELHGLEVRLNNLAGGSLGAQSSRSGDSESGGGTTGASSTHALYGYGRSY